MDKTRTRAKLTKDLQIAILQRDSWLCHWCKRPVIFAPAMRLLQVDVQNASLGKGLAYHHPNWTRHNAPLLDELGAVLDHVEAFSSGGACEESNLVTACSKCNVRKSAAAQAKWETRDKRAPIKGKYGEPQYWDGLSTLFVVLAERNPDRLTVDERAWLKALRKRLSHSVSLAS